MSNGLAILTNLVVAKAEDFAEARELLTGGGNFLPRIQLMGKNSGPVEEGKVEAGNFVIVNDSEVVDLTSEFDCIPLCVRPKAMRIEDSGIQVTWDRNGELFKDIQALAAVKVTRIGNLYGLEFLIWVPNQGFATYFAGNPTARRAAGSLVGLTEKRAATCFKSNLIERGIFRWYGPSHTGAATIITDMPTQEQAQERVNRYMDQTDDAPVEAAEGSDRD